MDIGKEKEKRTIEPAVDPVPRKEPAPAPEPKQPTPEREPEKVPSGRGVTM